MRKVLFIVFLVLFSAFAFGAVKFKGDLLSIGDFKYMQSNYVYNNKPTVPYFGLDNVEFIVKLGSKLELTSDVYGMVDLIIQPTTKFKHVAVDNLMINYFYKTAKVKIVPFYRYRVVRFDDPENSVGWFNSWIISSSVFGISNVYDSKVDTNGFYVDSSSPATLEKIPYILRPVNFMDGTIVPMPGMGEDTTNLSLVGRDLGGFYAEQRAKSYLWQIFLGSYFIDNGGSTLNLLGALNAKFNIIEFDDLGLVLSGGFLANFNRFGNYSLPYIERLNSYEYTIPDLRSWASIYNYGAYVEVGSDYGKLYVQALLNSQGQLFASLSYNEILTGGGYRFSGGLYSDIIPGIKIDLSGSYSSYSLVTNTNVGVSPESAGRYDVKAKLYGSYETILGVFNLVSEFVFFKEDNLNRFASLPDFGLSVFHYLDGGIVAKGGIDISGIFDLVSLNLLGSYESLNYKNVSSNIANVSIISARGNLGIDLSLFVEGLAINLGGGIYTYSDNFVSKGFLPSTSKQDLNLMYYSISPNLSYKPSKFVVARVGYGWPMFGDINDIDYGIIADALSMVFYKNTSNIHEGIYGWYVLQNLPRVYVDLKISF
ncbi:MAG: hypothetical protein ACPL4C_01595 [Brevinematia bacterium]